MTVTVLIIAEALIHFNSTEIRVIEDINGLNWLSRSRIIATCPNLDVAEARNSRVPVTVTRARSVLKPIERSIAPIAKHEHHIGHVV